MTSLDCDLLLLVSHGTVAATSELPPFLKAIRRGAEPSPELIAEVTHRYEAIGGVSPLNQISERLAQKVEAKLGVTTRYAARLWNPRVENVVPGSAKRIRVVALAQYSSALYTDHVKSVLKDQEVLVAGGPNWGSHSSLLRCFAKRITSALAAAGGGKKTALLLTAHSLPKFLIDQGDTYERDFLASTEALRSVLADSPVAAEVEVRTAFQSQGMSTGPGGRPMVWLGPDLAQSFAALRDAGFERVLVSPIGFLADHVEILYDLDIEAKKQAAELGLELLRSASLNDDDDFVDVICEVAQGTKFE
jgi:protoporphyrin/coproporphyrin ferrochelatase